MPEYSDYRNDTHFKRADRKFFENINIELSQYINELQSANEEIENGRRAALNMMEDAIQSREALRRSEERLHMAVESGNIGTCDWNYFTGEMQWNDVCFRLCGMEQQNRLMRIEEYFAIVRPDDVEKIKWNITSEIETNGKYAGEYPIKYPDGNLHWVYVVGRVVERKDGKPYRVISVLFDITERKKMEQLKEDFISIASHELKTPVTSIKAYIELLHEVHEEGDHNLSASLIKKLETQVDHLVELVRTLLDVTNSAEDGLPLNSKRFNLKELVAENIEEFAHLSSIHRIVAQSKTDIYITADRERISQVLSNLISNAIKYSPKGGDVTINWTQSEAFAEISVRDEGIGISEETTDKVFGRFFREKNMKMQNYPGLGLGLYIAAGIIHGHGGKIWAESTLGEGSTFHFTLPLKK